MSTDVDAVLRREASPPAADRAGSVPATRRAPTAALLMAGVLAGALWGVAARVWMRQLTFEPGFSWSGTLFIVGAAAVFGLSCAVVEVLRRRCTRPWRLLAALPGLLLFAGPGLVLLPGAVLTGVALSGRGPRWVTALAAGLAQVPVVWMSGEIARNPVPSSPLVALGGAAVLVTTLGLGTRSWFLPRG